RGKRAPQWWPLLTSLVFWGISCLLYVWGPVADREDARQEWRPVVCRILAEAGGREIALFQPTDEVRGALGFYRHRPGREVGCTDVLLFFLDRNPRGILVFPSRIPEGGASIDFECARRGIALEESVQIPFRRMKLALVKAQPVAPPGDD